MIPAKSNTDDRSLRRSVVFQNINEQKNKTMTDENVKVQVAMCTICGHNIKISATKTSFSRATTREFAKLMEAGFVVKQSTLEEARSTPMYCNNYPKCQK